MENVLWLFERAVKIRDSPQAMKPIPINSFQASVLPPSPASSPKKKLTPGEKIKRSVAQTTSKVERVVTSIPRPHSSDVEKDQLREELFKVKEMNFNLSEQIEKGVAILHQEVPFFFPSFAVHAIENEPKLPILFFLF